ncbi:ArsR/SmtB family transcription factor [Paraburkholderia rhizosphaerae]|uniref:ArsR family transcriptional regulator n=1 Tax=Paraburkholderia rhizosphaerae TaxID=480658 RepID=A0A4R8M348_9BURK|nr:metalloregulator ArsR/SmtB family transcription factor [Paraburkholderia rhizosphaerae]TDY54004.1 ArsR family transcriptional regulator [Paraburkholderia rhizosphaerae]
MGAKQAIFERLAGLAQAFGHPGRLELLEYLAQRQRSVEELTALSGMSFANTSRHLQVLRRARLVDAERRGKNIVYRLAGHNEIVGLMNSLGRIGERNDAEVRQTLNDYFYSRDSLEAVSRDELARRLADGLVTVLDVRPHEEFAHGHLPGACNIPLAELERRLAELPIDTAIVAYCRGPYCVLSFEAVAALRAKGFNALRLEDGFPEWKAAGFAIETGVAAWRFTALAAARRPTRK